jgi:hypothetical protein
MCNEEGFVALSLGFVTLSDGTVGSAIPEKLMCRVIPETAGLYSAFHSCSAKCVFLFDR